MDVHEVYVELVKTVFCKERCIDVDAWHLVEDLLLSSGRFSFQKLVGHATGDVVGSGNVVASDGAVVEGTWCCKGIFVLGI